MRCISCMVVICMFFVSCSSIKVTEDSFRSATIVTMNMDHRAHVDGFDRNIISHGSQYTREIKDGQKLPATIIFKLPATPNITRLSNEAYIKVDGNNTKLSLVENDVQTEINISQSNKMNYMTDKRENKTDAQSLNVLMGKLIIPLEVEQSIMKAKAIQYRLYFNNNPIDLTVSARELTKIKQFFQTTGKK